MPGPTHALMLALVYQMQQSEWWPPEALARMQLRQLEVLVRHAANTVPFYGSRLRGVRKIGRLTWPAWRRVPILRRADIQEQGAALVSRGGVGKHGRVHEMRTLGSTGRPISVKKNQVTATFVKAIEFRYRLWHRWDFSGRVAVLKAMTSGEKKRLGRRLGWVPGHASGPAYAFDLTRPLTEQFEWLVEQDPDYLLVTPSVLRALLERCRDKGVRLPRLRQVSTINETLDPEVRELCAKIWGVPVIDVYSAEEVGMIALQCPDHPCYHVQAENLLVEILDDDGRPCGEGEVGRVVLTDLHNFTTPLIRYEIGDYAEVGPPCACGRGLPTLNRILGRSRNMLTLPSGERIWPQMPTGPLLAITALRQIQVIQPSVDALEVKLVVDRPLTDDEERQLDRYFTDSFRHSFSITYVYVDEIPRHPSGKFESFMSAVEG